MRIPPFLFALFLFLPAACYSGGDSASVHQSAIGIMESDGFMALKGAGYVFSSPVRWRGSDWLRFGAEGVGTLAASGLDIDGRDLMQRNQRPGNRDFAVAAEQYGAGQNMILLSVAGYFTGLALDDAWIRQTSLLAGSAMLIAGTVSTVTKIVVGRARPNTGHGHGTFRPFTFTLGDFASFPSGHTIVAFAFSGVLAERIGNTWASIGLYGLAATCGVSRLYTDEHWVSDVVFGAVISVSVSHSLVKWFEHGGEPSDDIGLRVVPGLQGIRLVWTF